MFNSSSFFKKHLKRFISFILVLSFLFMEIQTGSSIMAPKNVYAASVLRLSTAKSVAVAKSEKIESLDLQIDAKQAAKKSAIKSLEEKQRNMASFRWSPLLSFKFPESPNEAQAFEFQFKPTQLQYNIDTLQHKKNDAKLQEYEAVSNLYIDIITFVTEIGFLEERIGNMEVTISKNKAKVAEGTASQTQVDDQQKKLDKMKKDLATQQKKLLRSKEKLGKKLGFSIVSGYSFEEQFIVTNMNRDTIDSLQAFALENDETVYEARQEMELARLNLEINYNLISRKYGGNIGMISGYIRQITASDNSSVDKRAFKKDYDAFLKKIDEPWQGSWRIWFFKIPKEWLKGSLDGIRYVEDDPYVLYTAALDYQAARKEYNNACDELKANIADGYDGLMEARDAYISANDNIKKEKVDLLAAETRNALGNLSFEEYDTMYEEYETARSDLKEALSTYSKLLYSFDKTTCGAASSYFLAESLALSTGSAALGTPDKNGGSDAGAGKKVNSDNGLEDMNPIISKGCTYSIRSIVDSQEFVLYVDKPDDFDIPVTDFELWADGRQIGNRQKISEGSIRHLKLAVTDVNSIFVRIYSGDQFIDDCPIDPNVSFGPLNITKEYEIESTDSFPVIGQFTVEDDTSTDMIKVRFTFDGPAIKNVYKLGGEVKYFNMAAEKNLYLFSNELIDKEKPFTYMSFIKRDLGKLSLRMFDVSGNYIGGARLDTNRGNLYADEEITNADMQQMIARQIVAEEKSADLISEKKRYTDLYNAAISVTGTETESATINFYKQKLDEIDNQLKAAAANVSDEEIAQALIDKKDEIEKRFLETGTEGNKKEVSADEVEARNNILKEGAKEIIRKARIQSQLEALKKSLKNYENELVKAESEYRKASGYSQRNKALSKVKDLAEKIKITKAKIKELENNVLYDDGEVTDAQIEEALLTHADEIYAAVADKLSLDMLYGTPTGQWAVQYLKSLKLEDNEANVRSVVSHANEYESYEANVKRKAALENDLKNVKAKIEKLKKQGSASDKSCVKQLEPMVDSLKRQISDVEKQIKATDPARDIR